MTTMPSRGDAAPGATVIASLTNGSPWTRSLSTKVPEVSLSLWGLTLLAVAVASTEADFVATEIGAGLGVGMPAATAIISLVVAGTLIRQIALGRFHPASYWAAVLLVSLLGIMVSDDMVEATVNPWVGTGVFGALLLGAFAGWHGSGPRESIHAVTTRRRETWYWLVVLAAAALGNAISEVALRSLGLSYPITGMALTVPVVLVACATYGLRLPAAPLFWALYVALRPMCAALGGFLSDSRYGGLGLGLDTTSAVFLGTFLVAVGLVAARFHRATRRGQGRSSLSRR